MLTLIAATSLVIAVVALVRLFAMKRKLDAVSQSHWELRYEFARLRARVGKLDGNTAPEPEPEPAETTDHV